MIYYLLYTYWWLKNTLQPSVLITNIDKLQISAWPLNHITYDKLRYLYINQWNIHLSGNQTIKHSSMEQNDKNVNVHILKHDL